MRQETRFYWQRQTSNRTRPCTEEKIFLAVSNKLNKLCGLTNPNKPNKQKPNKPKCTIIHNRSLLPKDFIYIFERFLK